MSDLPHPPAADPAAYDQERERLHRQMLSTISHDLKTPIASIIGSLEVYERMKDRLAPDKQQALIQVALQEAHRLDNFVTNILDMAKFENALVKVKREKIDVAEILRDSLSQSGARMGNRKVQVTGPKTLDAMTDGALLARALNVVLNNAVKYAGEEATITIELSRINHDGAVAIRDNGPGITAEAMEKIFEKYARFPVNGVNANGMGLGLALGRAIMRMLEGDLTAANHPAGGAVFTLRFKAA